jgi:hypothetical protein
MLVLKGGCDEGVSDFTGAGHNCIGECLCNSMDVSGEVAALR